MYLRYHAGRSIRHVGGAIAEGALVIGIAGALVFGVAVVGGGAPPGAEGVSAGGSVPTGTISLGGAAARSSALTYGSEVRFNTDVNGRVGPKARVYVTVLCQQGGTYVYQWSADPDFQFPLVQQDGFAALGQYWDPSKDASCTGSLMYKEDGGKTLIVALDRVGFATAGK